MTTVYWIALGLFLLWVAWDLSAPLRARLGAHPLSVLLPDLDGKAPGAKSIIASAYLARGRLYHEAGLHKKAVLDYNLAADLDPALREIHVIREAALQGKPLPALPSEAARPAQTPAWSKEKKSPFLSESAPSLPAADSPDLLPDAPPPAAWDNSFPSVPDATPTLPPSAPAASTAEAIEAIFKEAVLLHNQGHFPAAIQKYSLVLARNPKHDKAYFNRGSAYVRTNDVERALSDFDRFIILDPTRAEAYYKRGNLHLHRQEFEQALGDYSRSIRIQPDMAKAYNKRGVTLFRMERYEAAVSDFTRAIVLAHDFADAYRNRGLARQQLGLPEQAERDLRRADSLKGALVVGTDLPDPATDPHALPAHSMALLARAREEAQGNNLDLALQYMNEVAGQNPHAPEILLERAGLYLRLRQVDLAIADLDVCIPLDPGRSESYNRRGEAYMLKNLYGNAAQDFGKAIDLDPHAVPPRVNRAKLNSQRGQHEGAIADLSQAIEHNPDSDLAFYERGKEWQNLGNFAKAMDDFNTACAMGNNAACIAFVNLKESLEP